MVGCAESAFDKWEAIFSWLQHYPVVWLPWGAMGGGHEPSNSRNCQNVAHCRYTQFLQDALQKKTYRLMPTCHFEKIVFLRRRIGVFWAWWSLFSFFILFHQFGVQSRLSKYSNKVSSNLSPTSHRTRQGFAGKWVEKRKCQERELVPILTAKWRNEIALIINWLKPEPSLSALVDFIRHAQFHHQCSREAVPLSRVLPFCWYSKDDVRLIWISASLIVTRLHLIWYGFLTFYHGNSP